MAEKRTAQTVAPFQGTDLRLDYALGSGFFEDADLASERTGTSRDLSTAAGLDNLTQAIANRLKTRQGELAPLALDQGMALVPWSPLKNGFLSGKYRRGVEVSDSVRTTYVGGPSDEEFVVIDAVAAIAYELETSCAAVSLAWLRAREGTVVPIVGARRLAHLEDNLAAVDVTLSAEHLRMLDDVSAPTLNYPAEVNGATRAMLQFAGSTVDGESSKPYPPLLQSDVRY